MNYPVTVAKATELTEKKIPSKSPRLEDYLDPTQIYYTSYRERDETGYIYIIKTEESERIKIGKTNSKKSRFSSIASSCPEKIIIVALYECENYHRVETECLEKFEQHRLHGEWFSSDISVDMIINFLESKGNDISTVVANKHKLVQRKQKSWRWLNELNES